MGGRELKNKAQEYIDTEEGGAEPRCDRRGQGAQGQAGHARGRSAAVREQQVNGSSRQRMTEFDGMDAGAAAGIYHHATPVNPPHGNLQRKTLVRMAHGCATAEGSLMTLLTVVKDVCAAVGVLQPQSVFTNITGNRTMQEMVALANEMAQRIAYDTRDWTRLRTTQTYTGDGVTTAFDLPANYKRMLLTANVWRSTSTQQPMMFIPDPDEWIMRRAAEQTDAWGEWTMMGGQMHIHPALGADETAFFAYLDKNCVTLNAGGFGDTFVNDADTFRLDERVFKLGMIWQWKNARARLTPRISAPMAMRWPCVGP